MLRQKQPPPVPTQPVEPTQAIATQGFRPATIAAEVERWTILPIDHELVRAFPEFFRGLVSLDGGANDG